MTDKSIRDVFIIGSKGIPAAYGGFESFVDCLTLYRRNRKIRYHISCAIDREEYDHRQKEFTYHEARCFYIPWRKLGSARAVFYDLDALTEVISYIKKNEIEKPIVYILACRIGPFLNYYVKKIHKLGGRVLVNPDGHEWKRSKWSLPVRTYWKLSERLMVKHADMLVCDSKAIESYICKDYSRYHPATVFIPYGAETEAPDPGNGDVDCETEFIQWCERQKTVSGEYYLVVGRFVPENNFEVMIREFMETNIKRDLVLITSTQGIGYYETLRQKLGFDQDPRIKFAGTVYNRPLLRKIREHAYGYLHGHEVGGTNPSLLEALGSTGLNLLLDVEFNREVGEDSALYWTKKKGSLRVMIQMAELMCPKEIADMEELAKARIRDHYSWETVISRYETLFLQ